MTELAVGGSESPPGHVMFTPDEMIAAGFSKENPVLVRTPGLYFGGESPGSDRRHAAFLFVAAGVFTQP